MKEKHIGIMLVHSATATVCSLRTRGMLAGTKLHAGREQFHFECYSGMVDMTCRNGRTPHVLEEQRLALKVQLRALKGGP